MPQLRSGARRSKRLGDLQPAPQPVDQAENLLPPPAQNRTRRRGGAGAGRGRGSNAAAVTKGPSAAVPGRPTCAGRGRGIKLIDLDPELPCAAVPQNIVVVPEEPVLNKVGVVADKNIEMEGGSGDKVVGVEEDINATPVPERVFFCFCVSLCYSLFFFC